MELCLWCLQQDLLLSDAWSTVLEKKVNGAYITHSATRVLTVESEICMCYATENPSTITIQLFPSVFISGQSKQVSGWCVPLDCPRLPESRLCFIAWEKRGARPLTQDMHRWVPLGPSWLSPPLGLQLQTTRGGLGSQHPRVTEGGKEVGSWNNIQGNPRIGGARYLIPVPHRATPEKGWIPICVNGLSLS